MVSRHLTLPHEFHVFTDDSQEYPEGIIKRDLPHPGLTGWWNKIALFKPGLFQEGDRVLYFDLDTLIVGSLNGIASYQGEHARLGPFFANVNPIYAGPQSGVMAWRGGFGGHIWQTYVTTQFPNLPGGDQKFLNYVAANPDLWQDLFPGRFCSFRQVGGIIPDTMSVVCFHGLPVMHKVYPGGWGDPQPTLVRNGRKKIGGYWWPQDDKECWYAMLATADESVEMALRHTKGRSCCVQAGGNVGVFPKLFAKHFGRVHSFEPDPDNFACLEINVLDEHVSLYQAALVSEETPFGVSLARNPENAGQSRINGMGDIVTMRIDDIAMDSCDLICLDIEGFEKSALEGAAKAIRKFAPTIVIEDNGLSEQYGIAKGETPQWVCETFGYRIADQVGRDVILVSGKE